MDASVMACQRTESTWKRVTQWWGSQELLTLLRLGVPIILTLVLQQLPVFISLLFVGWIKVDSEELSSLNLDAAALGTSIFNITAVSAFTGMSSAADTLLSQTYGFGNYKRVGVIFQRGLLISLLATIFMVCLVLNTENLLLLVQQEPCVAKYTAVYVRILLLAYPLFALYVMLQKFLQTQSIVWPFIFTGLLANVINIGAHAFFIFGLGLGIEGAAGGLVIANFIQPLFLIVYIKLRNVHKKTWKGWSLDSLEGWPEYLKLAVPGTLMVSAEWTGYEIIQIVLGIVSPVELAVSGILSSYIVFVFMIPYGLGIAVSIRIGNELGRGNVLKAKRVVYISSILMGIITTVVVSVTFGLRTKFGELYNAEEEVQNKLKTVVYVICVMVFGDQVQGFLGGIVRGAGHQLKGAISNQVAYYVFGLPIGIGLGVGAGMGALGVWIGLAIASNLQMACILVVILRLDWNKEAELAMKRGAGSTEVDNPTRTPEETKKSNDIGIELTSYCGIVQEGSSRNESEAVDQQNRNEAVTAVSVVDTSIEGAGSQTENGNEPRSFNTPETENGIETMQNRNETELTAQDHSEQIENDMQIQDILHNDEITLVTINKEDHHKNSECDVDGNIEILAKKSVSKTTTTCSRCWISSLRNRLVFRARLLCIHSTMVAIAIACLVISGITSFLPFPESLINYGNYTVCFGGYDGENSTDQGY